MSPTSTEVSISATLIEIVMIVLPIWLAAIRYLINEFEGEEDMIIYISNIIVLVYVSLAAMLVSAGGVLTDLGNHNISSAVYGLWLLFSATGAVTFKLLSRKIGTDDSTYILIMGKYTGYFLIGASLLLLTMSGLKAV